MVFSHQICILFSLTYDGAPEACNQLYVILHHPINTNYTTTFMSNYTFLLFVADIWKSPGAKYTFWIVAEFHQCFANYS